MATKYTSSAQPNYPGDPSLLRSNNNTPASTIKSEYAMLESNTPVESTQAHRHDEAKTLQRLPSALPMPKIVGPPARQPHVETQAKRSSFVAILGGSGMGRHANRPLGNSRRGHSRRAVGVNTTRSSFLPSSAALDMNIHPSMLLMSRPSRQMNKAELYELKDQIWKSSLSSAPNAGLGASAVGSDDCGNPHAPGQLSFFTQAFNTSRITVNDGEGSVPFGCDDPSRSSIAFIPLPRESVAMMVDAVRVSVLEDNEKCRFLFEIFDVDHRGVLSKEGVRAFIEATFAANGVDFVGAFDYDAVVDKVFGQCRQQDKMSYSEFKTIFAHVVVDADDDKSKDALGKMSTVVEGRRQQEIVHNSERGGRWYRIKKFCRKYKPEIFWLTLYFLLMIGVFIAKASRFPVDPAVGNCPRVAKGFAEICLVNTMFVLLPMCRNFVTGLRTLPVVVNYLPVDNHIEFHKICGVVLLIASFGHTAAWLAIVVYVRTVPLSVWEESRYHHLTFVRDENLLLFVLRLPIWTGVAMLICAAIAAPLCLEKFRRGKFNLFWITHMLFIPFLVLMAFHGFARWVAFPQAHYWVLPPVIIYLVEKRYRMTQMFGGQTKIALVQLSKESVAIFMKKPKSFSKRHRFLPGMYVYVNVPTISKYEWHPFTISSAPEDKFLSLHVQRAGDWTGALYNRLDQLHTQHEASRTEDQGSPMTSPYPAIFLDGPIGSPAQDYSSYREVVLIGAGIGVTPFASILRSIMHQWESFRCPHCRHVRFPPSFQLRKIYFYWVTREQESLTWFTNTMNQLSEMDTENRLEIHNFFSSVKNEAVIAPLQALQNFIHNAEGQDIISGLHTKQQTHFGRPDWNAELTRVARNHRLLEPKDNVSREREEIGVFFCGPKPLGNVIHEQCTVLNQVKIRQTPDVEFDFHSENF
ncbi:NADPH oxidase 4 [Phytophthora pseudosyringae]|uniref:NADPH oxidase 4 n=1 Tax=Phytophthora pseudosyringae TaxID=221518 RepID=A0A8T1V5I4_9STRA|nr:NADPH oxidase 4 [Phytophthora pseudosyringae]